MVALDRAKDPGLDTRYWNLKECALRRNTSTVALHSSFIYFILFYCFFYEKFTCTTILTMTV